MGSKLVGGVLLAGVMGVQTACVQNRATEIPILAYHQILESADAGRPDQITVARFEEQMQYLADQGYRTVTMDQLIDFMEGGWLPEKSFVLQFDDGWTSQKRAIPTLKKHGFEASFWIFPEGRHPGTYFSWDDIRDLSGDPDFEIESHSLTHPWSRESNLVTWVDGRTPGKSPADARREIEQSKQILEAETGTEVKYLAWPMGWYNDALITMAREAGYEAALSIEAGANRPGDDVFQIKRLAIDGACDQEKFRELMTLYRYPSCDGGPLPQLSNSPYPDSP